MKDRRRQRERDKVQRELKTLPQQEMERLILTLEEEMHEASAELRFEYAASFVTRSPTSVASSATPGDFEPEEELAARARSAGCGRAEDLCWSTGRARSTSSGGRRQLLPSPQARDVDGRLRTGRKGGRRGRASRDVVLRLVLGERRAASIAQATPSSRSSTSMSRWIVICCSPGTAARPRLVVLLHWNSSLTPRRVDAALPSRPRCG